MITPTVGRVVWYYPAGRSKDEQPCAATIAYVHDDNLINIGYWPSEGPPAWDKNVLLVQDENSYGNPDGGGWCCWMPYQKNVAAGKVDPVLHADPAKAPLGFNLSHDEQETKDFEAGNGNRTPPFGAGTKIIE